MSSKVVAILAAGAWAIYTFVYEQRIKPANAPPTINLTGSLQRIGERDGMVEMAYHATLRNTGQTRIYTIADGIVAVGLRYASTQTAVTWTPAPGVTEYDRSVRPRSRVIVYSVYELTRYADPKYPGGFEIDPGETVPFSGVFFVRKGDFDAVELQGSVAYTKYDGVYPTKVTHLPNEAFYFTSVGHKYGYAYWGETIDHASMW